MNLFPAPVRLFVLLLMCAPVVAQEKPKDPVAIALERRLAEYGQLRARAEKACPPMSKKSTPQEIAAHQRRLAQEIRKLRPQARAGDLFGDELTARIRKALQARLRRASSNERRAVEDDKPGAGDMATKVAINGPYPADSRAMMPPDLLAILPPLPDGLEYRFVKDDLLLVDTKAELVVDLVHGALP